MPWYGWVIVGELGIAALWKAFLVGRPRQPVTGLEAFLAIIELGLLIWATLALGGLA